MSVLDFLSNKELNINPFDTNISLNIYKQKGVDTFGSIVVSIFKDYGFKIKATYYDLDAYNKTDSLKTIQSRTPSEYVKGDLTIFAYLIDKLTINEPLGLTNRFSKKAHLLCNFRKLNDKQKVLLFAHELGHALGAHHNNVNYSIMNPHTPYKWLFVSDYFLTNTSIKQIYEYLVRVGLWKSKNSLKVNGRTVYKGLIYHINKLKFTSNYKVDKIVYLNQGKVYNNTVMEKLFDTKGVHGFVALTTKGWTNPVFVEIQ